jgi:4-hydroxy-tetrahydrodipicolinate synthase
MPGMTLILRTATTFAPDGSLDEEAFREHLQRFVDNGLSVYLASGGSGEGHSLTFDEIKRVYEIGVEVCKDKVLVNSNQPEQMTVRDTVAHAQLAVDAGVDVVNIYGPETRHGYVATNEEYLAYFDGVLAEVKHPVGLAPNKTTGYVPPAWVIADICNKYSQVQLVNLIYGDEYFVQLRDALKRDVDIYVHYAASMNTLKLGATGLLSSEANFIPRTFREYIDAYERDDMVTLASVYTEIRRVAALIAEWRTPRWIKMAMRAFDLPGGAGGLRPPHLMPDDATIERFRERALGLNVREIAAMA